MQELPYMAYLLMIPLVLHTRFISVLAFMPISCFIINSVKWEGKIQIYMICRYMHSTDITLYQCFWYPTSYAIEVQICAQQCHSQRKTL